MSRSSKGEKGERGRVLTHSSSTRSRGSGCQTPEVSQVFVENDVADSAYDGSVGKVDRLVPRVEAEDAGHAGRDADVGVARW